jgi:hypothetical protein
VAALNQNVLINAVINFRIVLIYVIFSAIFILKVLFNCIKSVKNKLVIKYNAFNMAKLKKWNVFVIRKIKNDIHAY